MRLQELLVVTSLPKASAAIADSIAITAAAGTARHNKHVRCLPPIHIRLLLRHAGFDLPASPVRTAGGDDAAHDEKDVPEKKGNEFVRVVAAAAGRIAAVGTGATNVLRAAVLLTRLVLTGSAVVSDVDGVVGLKQAQDRHGEHAGERSHCFDQSCQSIFFFGNRNLTPSSKRVL